MKADHRRLPFTIGMDKHASYPEAFATSVAENVLPFDCKLRRVKYLNNVIEQDHWAIRRRWRAAQCFRSFQTAERALEGIEAMHMMRKGQVKKLGGKDSLGQAKFVESRFGIAAQVWTGSRPSLPQSNICNTTYKNNVILAIIWDAVWLSDEIAQSTSIVAEWPLLFVKIEGV